MADIIQKINPRSWFFDMTVDPDSLNIPDWTPDVRDASSGVFPNTQPNVWDRRIISNGWTLPAPIWAVEPQDYIVWDGSSWTVIYAPDNILTSVKNELLINPDDPEIVWKQYQTFADAFEYLNTLPTMLAPSQMNRWAVRFSWTHTEELDVPEYVHLVGDWKNTSALFGGVSFMGVWGDVVSSISAYNCLINLDQKSYSTNDPIQTQVDVMFSEYSPYMPPALNIDFKIAPTTWQIRVMIYGDEFLFGPGTTAQQMQDEIRGYSSKYSQVVVEWAMVDNGNLLIFLNMLPNFVSVQGIGMAEEYTSDALMDSNVKMGQNQEIYFGFSRIPEGWSFDLTFNNNDSVQILYSDIDENSNVLETKINDRFAQTYAPSNPWAFWSVSVQRTSPNSFNLTLRLSGQPYGVWVANNSLFFWDTPISDWPRIWLYDCGIWDAQSQVVSRLNLFNTDIYKWDFENIDVNIEWWYINSSQWEIRFLRSVTANNSTFNTTQRKIHVSEAKFMNSVIEWTGRIFNYDSVRKFIGCYIPHDIHIEKWTTEMHNCCGWWRVYYNGQLFFRWVNSMTPINNWDGTFVNYWDYYDNRATWMVASDLQSAIDELFFYNRKSQYLNIPSGTYYFSKVDAKKFFSLNVQRNATCSMDSSFDVDDVIVFHNRYTANPLTVKWFSQEVHLVWEWNVASFQLYPGEIAIGKKTGQTNWTFYKTTKYLGWDHIAINNNVISATYNNATINDDWLMSKEDKAIVDWLSDVATSWSYTDLINTPDFSALAEIVEVDDYNDLPWTWENWKVYITVDTWYMYRWNWTWYTQLTDQTAIRWQISWTLLNQIDLKNALNAKQDKLIEWNNITIDPDWKTINADYAEISETDIKDTVGQTKWLLTGRRMQKYKEDILDPLYAAKSELTVIPQNKQNNDYTLTIDDAGKHLYYDSNVTYIWTIPADSDVAYPIGTTITFINWGSDDMVIKIDQDTMVLADSWTIGDRTLAPNWVATATKVDNTRRFISWNWLS